MANEYSVNQSDLVSVANAIRTKGGTSETLVFPAGFVSAVQAIQAGGGGTMPSASSKDVNFYDYNGTLLYSYTLEEAQALTALPDGPVHDGLVFDGWNYSLESVKILTRPVNIGAMYSTDDGTTRIYIHLEDGRISPTLGICPNGTVTVDWGDGTTPDILTGTSLTTVQWAPTHNYVSSGDYVIKLTVDGEAQLYGSSSSNGYAYILRYGSASDTRNRVYQNSILKVEIGAGIRIGTYAFSYCYSLSSITIPDSVTSIGTYAFSYCSSLSSITIPDGVTSIGNNAFYNCYSLSSITIPDGVTSIGSGAFSYCYSLSSITIPYGVTSIGNNAFSYCSSLSSITIPDGVISIGTHAFRDCYSLSSITIPDGVTSIGTYAFYNCYSLSSITIPNGVTSIETYAFYYCYGIGYYDFTALSAVPTLSNTNSFTGITDDCKIRVPATLAEEWKAATNWATYADYIVGV
ncbi:MAG: leucine-rich repeat domain-containing protein [Clostridiales bacterium]|nr:leucine-rich repeat domain-containing protein [Clostridiales bacterium]